MRGIKQTIRKDIRQRLLAIDNPSIQKLSNDVAVKLLALDEFKEARAVSTYLSMEKEVQTTNIISPLFATGKRVFIPKVLGKGRDDMVMFELMNEEQLNSFDKNNWGIPEPSLQDLEGTVDGTNLGVIDIVICPGVAFDAQCRRLGHGKGYYDTFIERLEMVYKGMEACPTKGEQGGTTSCARDCDEDGCGRSTHPTQPIVDGGIHKRRVVLVGLSLDEQIIEQVPTDEHDRALDYVITPTTIYQRIASKL